MAKITMKMAKEIENGNQAMITAVIKNVMDEAVVKTAKEIIKMTGSKELKKLKDQDAVGALFGLVACITFGNEITIDRKNRFITLVIDKLFKNTMTPAVYKKYCNEWKDEKWLEEMPQITNEEFDKAFGGK